MYLLQTSVFVAFLSLDSKRMIKNRNGLFWCIKSSYSAQPLNASDNNWLGRLYDKFILKKPMKVILLMLTLFMTGFAIKGNLHLSQRFEPTWFLPNNSYVLQYINQRRHYYPDLGMDGAIFIGKVNYSSNFNEIHNLVVRIADEKKILKTIDSWTYEFISYSLKSEKLDVLTAELTDSDFHRLLSNYLWSPGGARFQKNFRFNDTLVCGQPTPQIEISSIDIIFNLFSGPTEHIPAMNRLKSMVRETNLSEATVWAKIFANWVTDEIIDHELYRNLGIAMLCVMLCTFVLILDVRVCFFIFLCVLLTVVDVAGFMYFWGLHIDIASCIALVLAVGLCVDFASHVGHTFLRLTGNLDARAVNTVAYIGRATLHGGLSTSLALVMLSFSDAYIFKTFFKIFFMVIIFGLFHGLVFLPIMLSLLGPPSYNDIPFETEVNPLQEISQIVDTDTTVT